MIDILLENTFLKSHTNKLMKLSCNNYLLYYLCNLDAK